ncbi:MAG: DUF3090 family protein [Actinomycetota bacterium]
MSDRERVPEVFSADYTGTAGSRTFYLQTKDEQGTFSYLVEKQQVALLAEKLRELLVAVDAADSVLAAEPERDPGLAIADPGEPQWRVGAMGLAYQPDDDRVLVFMTPVGEEQDEVAPPEEAEDLEAFELRLSLRRDQARSFALHAAAVLAEGRPICQLCGLPMDPEGHLCPASNGHRKMS